MFNSQLNDALELIKDYAFDDIPLYTDKVLQKQFRKDLRIIYNADIMNDDIKNIFNKAWIVGKNDWEMLVREYDRITRIVDPTSIFDGKEIYNNIIQQTDNYMKTNDFKSNPIEDRRILLVKFIKEKLDESIKNEYASAQRDCIMTTVIDFYESLYKTNLQQQLIEMNKIILEGECEDHSQPQYITMDIPLMIRLFEFCRENIKSDEALHRLSTNITNNGAEILTMDNYRDLINDVNGSDIDHLKRLSGMKS